MRTKLYYARRADGMSFNNISAYLSPLLGAVMRKCRPVAANDNNPHGGSRTTRMVAYNGGCSTTSGMVPVSVQRLSFLDGAQVAA